MALNAKQRRFVDEYLIDLNATQAATRAGYSAKTAQEQSSRLLSNVMVQSALSERMKDRESRTEITQDKVLAELAKIGFADIRNALAWGPEVMVVDEETGETAVSNGVALVPSEKIDSDTAAAIAEISQTAQGIKIKLHDKRAALVDIGRHLGMFKEKIELTGKDGGPVQTVGIQTTDPMEAAKVYQDIMAGKR